MAEHAKPNSFNTQPPEGGWSVKKADAGAFCRFNTQPPEGGWISSRLGRPLPEGFNTQPPEGGWDRLP